MPGWRGRTATSDGSRSISFCRPASTSLISSKRCMRSVRPRSSPGVCGPRSNKHADQRRLGAAEVEGFAKPVLVFGDAPVSGARAACKLLVFEAVQRLAHIVFIEIRYRFAIRALVARVDERIHRERVVVGRGDFFFDERAQDAGFGGGERMG